MGEGGWWAGGCLLCFFGRHDLINTHSGVGRAAQRGSCVDKSWPYLSVHLEVRYLLYANEVERLMFNGEQGFP